MPTEVQILSPASLKMTIKDLKLLLKKMNPHIYETEYVFCSLSGKQKDMLKLNPLLTFNEEEGLTVILKKNEADRAKIPYRGVWKMITLKVNSDLLAIGFLAQITRKLADASISVNIVSACHHDHLFVPADKSYEALDILQKLSKSF